MALLGVEGQGPFLSETSGPQPKNLRAPFENPKDSRNSQLSRKGKDECFTRD